MPQISIRQKFFGAFSWHRIVFLYLASIMIALTPAVCAATTPLLRVDPNWPSKLPNHWVLGQVAGVAVDSSDNVWIIQRPGTAVLRTGHARHPGAAASQSVAAPAVIAFSPSGKVVLAWGGKGAGYDWFGREHGIYVDQGGYVWLAGNGPNDGQVLKFTRDGRFVLQIGRKAHGAASNDVTRLGRPSGLAVDAAAAEIYIADGYENRRIIVFDSITGTYKRHWGAYGGKPVDITQRGAPIEKPPAQFGTPVHCVKLAHDGLVYVCDRANNRIQVFRKNGSFVREYFVAPGTRGLGSVWDLAFWPDTAQSLMLDADGVNNIVRLLRRDQGREIGAIGGAGRRPGEFTSVHSVAIDSHGNLFTAEVGSGRRLQRFVASARP